MNQQSTENMLNAQSSDWRRRIVGLALVALACVPFAVATYASSASQTDEQLSPSVESAQTTPEPSAPDAQPRAESDQPAPQPVDATPHEENAPSAQESTPDAQPRAESDQPAPAPSAASTREAGARKVITVNGVEVAFRWAPAGIFMMGSPSYEDNRRDDEARHEVVLTKGFWLAETETTQALWTAVMGENPSNFKGDDLRPVDSVSWDDCQTFIKKLNDQKIPGVGEFRLPTEAEWEYACRAGTTTAFYWGDEPRGDMANCAGHISVMTPESDADGKGFVVGETTRVGSCAANPWGLFDMIGNVKEWCADWYDNYPGVKQTDPQGAAEGSLRVLRGGEWLGGGRPSRSAERCWNDPNSRNIGVGFRLAMTDEEKSAHANAPSAQKPTPETPERKVVTINGVEVAFRWAPEGRFMMGSARSKVRDEIDETPHVVVLTRGFWIAETETTQALWTAVMGENPSYFTGDDLLPVENVSWYDCQEFVKKLNELAIPDVDKFRLPTEAEWEYACRAGTTTIYYWGNGLVPSKANCDWNYAGAWPPGPSSYSTIEVGSYDPNPWGLYDMVGNVWEWCSDSYGAYPKKIQTDPRGVGSGAKRVLRGGSWDRVAGLCCSASRSAAEPEYRSNCGGCRLVMDDSKRQ